MRQNEWADKVCDEKQNKLLTLKVSMTRTQAALLKGTLPSISHRWIIIVYEEYKKTLNVKIFEKLHYNEENLWNLPSE